MLFLLIVFIFVKSIALLGNQFYETTLPVDKIITPDIASNFDKDIQKFFYDQSYEATSSAEGHNILIDPTTHIITFNTHNHNTNFNSFDRSVITGSALNGSGGNYISNEAFYRIARVRGSSTVNSSTVKTGHLHLAKPNPFPVPPSTITKPFTPFTLTEIIEETKKAIERCLEGI